MNEILRKREIAPDVIRLDVRHPTLARKARPGQFVILRVTEDGERFPLTIADFDAEAGTISLIFAVVGKSTTLLAALEEGESILNLVGPLGVASEIEHYGRVLCVGGGIGVAPLYPVAKALKAAGNEVVAVLGARTKDLVILEKVFRAFADAVHVATDDGSYGRKGFVTDVLSDLLEQGEAFDQAWAIGPVPMMRAVCDVTRDARVPTVVSLNPIMVDGTGMCGGCRVLVGDEVKFACVDGPEFDGHLVDYDSLGRRLGTYRNAEQHDHETCRLNEQLAQQETDSAEDGVSGAPPPVGTEAPAAKKRVEMPERPPEVRVRDFDEVPLGYAPDQARAEAGRCLVCKKPQCVTGCPVGIDIPGFVKLIAEGEFEAAADRILLANALPAVCGRVCPQETQCEVKCVLGHKGDPVAIGNLERFAADWKRAHGSADLPPAPEPSGKRVAVVGSGPAGLTCAGELVGHGHEVVLLEALHATGGVLVYGIPEFRLPKAIVRNEVGRLEARGVQVVTDAVVGKLDRVDELLEDYDAVFLGIGAGAPRFLDCPGEDLVGVYSANEYLTRANLMRAYDRERAHTPILRSRRVAVVGGGNVAMDSARTALRLGADEVAIVYRRAREQMPARAAEIHHAEEEGIRFNLLTNPTRILGDDHGRVRAMECIRMELGEPDESGRRRPVPIEGSEFTIEVDTVVVAIGNRPNPIVPETTEGLETTRWGTLVADEETGRTTLERVWAGGDIVTGAATVISAMGAGQRAARDIDAWLRAPDPGPWKLETCDVPGDGEA
jgi:glutamate synthase (NADPH/NADH) small chain